MLAMRTAPPVVVAARNGDHATLRRWWHAAVNISSRRYHVSESKLKSMARTREVTTPRYRAMTAIRIATGCAYVPLSRVIGCDHSTVVYAFQKTSSDPDTVAMADELTKCLASGWDIPPPDWQKLAIANGWHPPTDCARHLDDHGGGEL